MKVTRVILCALAVSLFGCAHHRLKQYIKLTPPSRLCPNEKLPEDGFCLPVERLANMLEHDDMTVLQARPTASGTAGAKVLWLKFPKDGVVFKAKWKEAARGGSALNNEPRKELAAYELQKLFLDERDYVVPPTVGRCIPLDVYKEEVRPTNPTFRGTHCAFGVLSYWIEGIRELHGFSKSRFKADLPYRAAIANLNLFTYLIDHRDPRPSNFAITRDRDAPRAFSIDNGLAFSGLKNPRAVFLNEWEHLIIPMVPHDKIERLRRITREDLDKLATVAEFSIEGDTLKPIPPTAAFKDEDGVRMKDNVVQLGLTTSEIDDIEHRIKDLLHRVDTGDLPTY